MRVLILSYDLRRESTPREKPQRPHAGPGARGAGSGRALRRTDDPIQAPLTSAQPCVEAQGAARQYRVQRECARANCLCAAPSLSTSENGRSLRLTACRLLQAATSLTAEPQRDTR